MQTLIYVSRNLRRNRLRSTLTILSVGFSLALLTVLHGYMAMQGEWGADAAMHGRIVVLNVQGFTGPVPIAYVDRVRGLPGVEAAVPYAWYGGNYKEEKMTFAQFGTDPGSAFDVWDEYRIEPEQLSAWRGKRNGCVADRRLAEKRRWKIGEHIPLQGTIYPFNLDLVLCGVFETPKYTDQIWFHWKYLDEGLKQMHAAGHGNAGMIFAKTVRAEDMARVSKAIDDHYANSANPTRTQTEAAFAQMFTDMLGNVESYIRNIGLAVAVSLTLVTANSMAMSMRDRTTEIAVLKAIGFSHRRVLFLVLGEACAITISGGVLGLVVGCLCLQGLHEYSAQFFPLPIYQTLGPWLLYLVAASAAIGLASGLVPALRAVQLSVIDGLRRVV
jgi:putative ABC transport system permease protein